MKIEGVRSPADLVRGFFLLCHPGPVAFHMFAVTGLVLLAGWPHIPWNMVILVLAAHLAMQLSIAVFNEYCDRERDALSKKNKPIVRGLVHPHEALWTALLLMFVMVLLLLPLNPLALLVSLLYLVCGQSYNLGLKATPLSGIVFALALPLIPVYAFVSVEHCMPLVLWQIPVAAVLGVCIHLANSLPDIEEDRASQTHTLAVVLGRKGSFVVCFLLIFLAVILVEVLAITGLVSAQVSILLPTLLFVIFLNILFFIYFSSQTCYKSRKIYFYLVVLLCFVLAGGWLLSALI
jgi:4-hydroxybenzoate polyprenyltransferase